MNELLSGIGAYFTGLTPVELVWLGVGFLGQSLFFSRWIIQWIASERNADSQMPLAFWYMSLAGGLIVLSYAVYRRDPVFIAGQGIGAFVYLRNLMLIHANRKRAVGT